MKKTILSAVIAGVILAAVLVAFWIGGTIMKYAPSDSPVSGAPVDYVIILGCRLEGEEPGRCLETRIDTAVKALKERSFAMAVCCGAQGSDEEIAEAEAIARALERRGIPRRRILVEDQSYSTYENLANAKALLDQRTEGRPYHVAVVTSDFHAYRSRRLAKLLGFDSPIVLSAKTPTTLFYQNLLREIGSVMLSYLRYR